VLLPAVLREKALLKGDVAVLGNLNYLVVMNDARVVDDMKNEPFTDEDEDKLGI
jgi:DNA-binding transcriptional regulator/RsmH inhibitor MraZ